MLCKVCGAQIPDDAAECEFCGAKTNGGGGADGETKVISADEIKSAAAAAAGNAGGEIFDENEKKRREQMQKMMEDKKKQLSEIERRRNEKRQRQKRNKILVIALICALAVGAAGVGAYYVAQNVSTPTAAEATPVPTAAVAAVTTPSPAVTALPTPALNMTPAPNNVPTSASNSDSRSWTATGNGSASSSQGGSSSGGSSSSGAGSSSGGSSSSGSSAQSSKGSASSSGGSYSSAVSGSGIVSSNLSSQLITGGEVIYNSGTGRYLMTFTSGGTKYYANVSEGSTTDQIQNKSFTINAEPTQESYNGNTVYEITSMTGYSGDYILQNSGTELLTDSDIKGMSKYDLALARNEIYARHGRKFQTDEYNKYFTSKSWYSVNPNYNYSDDDSNLNETERKNVQFILNAEKK